MLLFPLVHVKEKKRAIWEHFNSNWICVLLNRLIITKPPQNVEAISYFRTPKEYLQPQLPYFTDVQGRSRDVPGLAQRVKIQKHRVPLQTNSPASSRGKIGCISEMLMVKYVWTSTALNQGCSTPSLQARSGPWCHIFQPRGFPADLWGHLWALVLCTRLGTQGLTLAQQGQHKAICLTHRTKTVSITAVNKSKLTKDLKTKGYKLKLILVLQILRHLSQRSTMPKLESLKGN